MPRTRKVVGKGRSRRSKYPRASSKAMYRIATKVVNRNIERKYWDVESSTNISSTGTIVDLCALTQGDTDYGQRNGDKVIWKSLNIKGEIVGADDYNTVRVMLVQWKEDDQTDPVAFASVLQDATKGWKSLYNHDLGFKFSVISDKVYTLSNNTAGAGTNIRRYNLRVTPKSKYISKTVKYIGGTVYGKGKLFLMMISDSSAGSHPFVDYYARLSYADG